MTIPPPGSRPGVGALQLVANNQALVTAPPSNYYASYASVPPASYDFTVRDPHTPDKPLQHLPILLRPDTYITITVVTRDNRPVAEMIDDTVDPKTIPDLPGRLTVRQFMDGAQVKITANRGATTQALSYGQSAVLDDLPIHITPLSMQATINGVPQAWNSEVDFGAARHATLIVVADPYGRFRPRIAYDGQLAGPGAGADTPRSPNPPAGSPASPSPARP